MSPAPSADVIFLEIFHEKRRGGGVVHTVCVQRENGKKRSNSGTMTQSYCVLLFGGWGIDQRFLSNGSTAIKFREFASKFRAPDKSAPRYREKIPLIYTGHEN